jgi:hypothetical protein
MPFIITTAMRANRYGANGLVEANVPHETTRIAVATLDEARATVWAQVFDSRSQTIDGSEVDSLPESGGSVGPLPDGTVIEVRPVAAAELARLAGCTPHAFDPDRVEPLLAAFNAR